MPVVYLLYEVIMCQVTEAMTAYYGVLHNLQPTWYNFVISGKILLNTQDNCAFIFPFTIMRQKMIYLTSILISYLMSFMQSPMHHMAIF